MLCRDISLPMRGLSFRRSYCQLPLLAGAGGAVRGGEVGEWGGVRYRAGGACVCILWSKGGAVSVGDCMLSWGKMYAVCCDSLLMLMESSGAVR